jgi:anti-sigma regulatory factor (Ser/Thr protein kinase)
LDAPLEKRRIGRLGLYFMRKVMDEVFVETVEGGKAVVLVKRRPVQRENQVEDGEERSGSAGGG